MTIVVPVEISAIHSGVRARAQRLHLSGHGRDDRHALETLNAAVRAWGHGLAAAGILTDALNRVGVEWRAEPDDIVVELVAQWAVT
jgi:hypothetical protein